MNDTQPYLLVGIPSLAVRASLAVSISVRLVQASGLRDRIAANELVTATRFATIGGSVRQTSGFMWPVLTYNAGQSAVNTVQIKSNETGGGSLIGLASAVAADADASSRNVNPE